MELRRQVIIEKLFLRYEPENTKVFRTRYLINSAATSTRLLLK